MRTCTTQYAIALVLAAACAASSAADAFATAGAKATLTRYTAEIDDDLAALADASSTRHAVHFRGAHVEGPG